jgi:hypothetical protein
VHFTETLILAGDPSRRWRRSHLNGSTGTTPAGSCAASADVLQQRPRPRKKADRLPVRVTEHNAIMPSGDGTEEVSETCTVITTLLDHRAAPADAVCETYLTR